MGLLDPVATGSRVHLSGESGDLLPGGQFADDARALVRPRMELDRLPGDPLFYVDAALPGAGTLIDEDLIGGRGRQQPVQPPQY